MTDTLHKLDVFATGRDDEERKLGHSITATTEFDAADALIQFVHHYGYDATYEARTRDTGELVARVSIDIKEVF